MEENLEVIEIPSVTGEVVIQLSTDEAEQLTNDIKSTTTALYVLLKRAHDTKAWASLGYKSWTEYISSEFDFSRARSYQLINQATVIEEINEASGVNIYLTEKEARDIKKRLPEITERLKEIKEQDLTEEDKTAEIKKRMAGSYDEQMDAEDKEDYGGDHSASDVDKAEGFQKSGFEKNDDDDGGNEATKARLTQEEEFLYEKLVITLRIFESLPDPSSVARIINRIKEEKAEVLISAKKSSEWISQIIKEIS